MASLQYRPYRYGVYGRAWGTYLAPSLSSRRCQLWTGSGRTARDSQSGDCVGDDAFGGPMLRLRSEHAQWRAMELNVRQIYHLDEV